MEINLERVLAQNSLLRMELDEYKHLVKQLNDYIKQQQGLIDTYKLAVDRVNMQIELTEMFKGKK